jgi:hypothetical protein
MSTKEEDEPTKCVEASSDGVKALVEKKKGHKVLTWRTGTSFWE